MGCQGTYLGNCCEQVCDREATISIVWVGTPAFTFPRVPGNSAALDGVPPVLYQTITTTTQRTVFWPEGHEEYPLGRTVVGGIITTNRQSTPWADGQRITSDQFFGDYSGTIVACSSVETLSSSRNVSETLDEQIDYVFCGDQGIYIETIVAIELSDPHPLSEVQARINQVLSDPAMAGYPAGAFNRFGVDGSGLIIPSQQSFYQGSGGGTWAFIGGQGGTIAARRILVGPLNRPYCLKTTVRPFAGGQNITCQRFDPPPNQDHCLDLYTTAWRTDISIDPGCLNCNPSP